MCRICEEYEAEQPNDSQQVQSERFDTILSLMQKMQDYGQPPKEIVSSMVSYYQTVFMIFVKFFAAFSLSSS